MKYFLRLVLIILVIFCCIGLFKKVYADTIIGYARVIDGDTLEINDKKIRLLCIDTPESNYRGKTQYCLDNETDCGKLAKEGLQRMVGSSIIRCDYNKTDVYGRILGMCQKYVFYNEHLYWNTFNYKLIEEGYAWYYAGGKECKPFKALFETAKKEGYGLFNDDLGGFKEPKLWRKTKTND